MEQEKSIPQKLTLTDRKQLTLTGVREVLGFSAEQVDLATPLGNVTVIGSDLRLRCLSLEDGTLIVQGRICGFVYEEPARKRGLFR